MSDQGAEAQLYNQAAHLLTIHENLLRDGRRNRPFYSALQKHVTRESQVLDIGAGSGLWAIVAARLGAKRVVAVEREPLLAGLIKALAKENKVAERVEVVQGDSTQVELGKDFDIVVSETIGHIIFDEQVTDIMMDARQRFLKPGGVLIPDTVTLCVAAGDFRVQRRRLPAGIRGRFGYFESLLVNIPVSLNNRRRVNIISEPRDLVRLDLLRIEAPPDLKNLKARWTQHDCNRVNCFAVWAEARLTEGLELSTVPTSSWDLMIYRIKPFSLERGNLEFTLTLTGATNYWTAELTDGIQREEQSYSPEYAGAVMLAYARSGADLSSHYQRLGKMGIARTENS